MSFLSPPQCPSCIRRLAGASFQQIRGAKNNAHAPTIMVKLLQDIPKFGAKGSVIPVTRGRMRNIWYPRKMADYMTAAILKKMDPGEFSRERDLSFRPDLQSSKAKVDLQLLSPAQSVSLLEKFIPPVLQFSRATVSAEDSTIHGSVTTTEVAQAIRTIAAANGEEGSRIVVNPEMVQFADAHVEGDRLKALGTYQFDIKISGTSDYVRRAVVIMKQEA